MQRGIPRRLIVALVLSLAMACSGGGGGGGASAGGGGGGVTPPPSPMAGTGPFIVVDQFGYLPSQQKIAVIRDPVTGFDAADRFTPGAIYEVIDAATNAVVMTGAASAWNSGATDVSSGDRVWWFDFSGVTAPGSYTVRDAERGVSSSRFEIGANVYRPVLVQAVRTFFYQRAGGAKPAANAGAAWADGASHLGPMQDSQARLFSAPNDASTERDVRGGWYDAGDYNKYTNWTADYVIGLLHAYTANPSVWTDDFNIPESGNGVPDLLDEIKWGLDWLVRMQNSDGSVLSIVGLSHESPPSAASGPSRYGAPNTSATLTTAAAFAFASKIYDETGDPRFDAFAADLAARAAGAYAWAEANPNVIFRNNDTAAGSEGLGAGQQEVDDYGRAMKRLAAAIYLYDLTGAVVHRDYIDAHFREAHMLAWGWVAPYEGNIQRSLLHYASLSGATAGTANAIESAYANGMNGGENWGAVTTQRDPYLAFIGAYTWGSNSTKSNQGALFIDQISYGAASANASDARNAAANYLHYLHGVNPNGEVYLSNMAGFGAENSVDQFFHSWFADGSARWDSVRASTYGPAPGFLVGGPNPSWNWDARCPAINSACGTTRLTPPFGQPDQKSYLDFNTSWPLNSWEVTENSNGYQTAYIYLLSQFVR